jgi:SAM-dependent methyltransferase
MVSCSSQPFPNTTECERLRNSWRLLSSHVDIAGLRIADIGCGEGLLARELFRQGARVTAVDPLPGHLGQLPTGIDCVQASLPQLPLADQTFDIVVCTDVIASMIAGHYSAAVDEWARLVRPRGWLLCSTALEPASTQSLDCFLNLVSKRFSIQAAVVSHHRLWEAARRLLEAPRQLAARQARPCNHAAGRFWHERDMRRGTRHLWTGLSNAVQPLCSRLHHAHWLRMGLERLSEWIWQEEAATHIIVLGRTALKA